MRTLLPLCFVLFLGCESTPSTPPAGTPAGDGGGPVASRCTAPTGAGTPHASITGSETWTAAGSPHVLSIGVSIPAGATLTVEPCAIVKLPPNAGIIIEGKLIGLGTADAPITFTRAGDAGWSSLETRSAGELRLAYTTLEGGGNPNGGRLTQAAMVDLRSGQEVPQPSFFADHVTLKGSGSLGVWAREGGAFAPGSTDLTITGGAGFPILAWTRAAGSIPPGTYTGNATDAIMIAAEGTRDSVKADMTLFQRGVPYQVGGETGGASLLVSDPSAPLLTIEPGVTLKFFKDTRLYVEAGALKAEGTAAAPIVFTSAEATPQPGNWAGILIGEKVDPRNRIAFATVAYAGGFTGVSSYGCPSPLGTTFSNEGAIIIFGNKPGSGFVTDTKIEQSLTDGIVRGWTGEEIDFVATNTFTGVQRCHQTPPKPEAGMCPKECPH